jgi:hypothetical protein
VGEHHDVRTTLTIDEDVARLLEKENRQAGEPMKQTVNRLLRCGLAQAAKPVKPKRFVVKPFDLGITSEQWAKWSGKSVHEILDEVDGPFAR